MTELNRPSQDIGEEFAELKNFNGEPLNINILNIIYQETGKMVNAVMIMGRDQTQQGNLPRVITNKIRLLYKTLKSLIPNLDEKR
jgi:hypothetical protein